MRADGPHVALVNEQNQIEVKRVTLGRDLGNRVVVAEGIRGGERLVVNPERRHRQRRAGRDQPATRKPPAKFAER